jgi:hypothetical protein
MVVLSQETLIKAIEKEIYKNLGAEPNNAFKIAIKIANILSNYVRKTDGENFVINMRNFMLRILRDLIPNVYRINAKDFLSSIYSVLLLRESFLDPVDFSWPNDVYRLIILRNDKRFIQSILNIAPGQFTGKRFEKIFLSLKKYLHIIRELQNLPDDIKNARNYGFGKLKYGCISLDNPYIVHTFERVISFVIAGCYKYVYLITANNQVNFPVLNIQFPELEPTYDEIKEWLDYIQQQDLPKHS